ncbi:MAG: PadR family transcriptional regulator [Thaumarchaeota archaeon]|nr:PadR family transcriptional regulator [Nitrososphaerota archaeon]
MIGVPKGLLRLAALKLLSSSSLSGTDLAEQISRITDGQWNPGPGSVYLILGELLEKGFITELAKREGNVRRYIVSGKGKEELKRISGQAEEDVLRQLSLLAAYSSLSGREDIQRKILSAADGISK